MVRIDGWQPVCENCHPSFQRHRNGPRRNRNRRRQGALSPLLLSAYVLNCLAKEDEVLFTIPRSLVLSTSTSPLPSLLPPDHWESLNTSWAGLILCAMFEFAKGSASRWAPYLAMLPESYDTLMFWTPEELAELQGSTVLGKAMQVRLMLLTLKN